VDEPVLRIPRAANSAIFGRRAELTEIERFLDTVDGAVSRIMLLSGQAGIGKTTLWSAGIEAATERGYRVVSARPTQVETGLAFAALGDLLGPFLEIPIPDLPEPQREALDAALLRVSAAAPPQPLGVSLAVLHVLRTVAAAGPILVAIDDVPWMDEASARVLDFSIRRLDREPVQFLVARRAAATDEPLPPWLETLPAGRLVRLDVGPLSMDETDALLRARLGLNLSRAVLARLHAISGGTPFYALELGRALQRRGAWSTPETLEVPRSLDGLIDARLAALDPAADETALYAAALAQPTVHVLVAATGPKRTRAGLEAAQAAGVLEVVDDAVRFAHPLLAAATYDRAATDRRRKVHERLAEVVTEPEERARHLARTALGPDESIARALEDGAAAAVRRGAPEVAAELAEESARLTPLDAADERRRRLMSAAEHLAVSGEIGRADELLAGISAGLPDGTLRADVLTRRAHLALILADLDVAETYLREAIPMTSDDRRLQVTIHNGLAGIGYLSWRGWRRARLHMFEALAQAHELGDPRLELQMLGHTATWTQTLGRPWRRLLERADALGVPIADVPIIEHPDLQFARILAAEGDVDEARRRMEGLIECARSIGDWTSLPRLLVNLASVEVRAGSWDRAERIAAEAHAGLLQTGEGAFYQDLLVTRLQLYVSRGDEDAARALWAETEPATSVTPYPVFRTEMSLSIARLDLALGDTARAHERLARIMAEPGRARLYPIGWEMIVADQVEALLGLGRKDEARRLLDPVERRARQRAIPAAIGEVARVRALVLAADRDDAAAVTAAEEAVRILAGLQGPFRTARAWFTLGEVLRRSRQKGASRQAFETALEMFTRLGARIWVDRTQTELGRVATRRPAGAALTETERRVAELAAAGHTNREIADTLFMSVHTVEAHLTRVFRALGVHTRTELARVSLDGTNATEVTRTRIRGS
jgi:ATP/maltotriose-dependent transcriptional regulator MalT